MKKIIAFVLVLVLTAGVFAGCGSKNTLTLNVYNWGEYISDGMEQKVRAGDVITMQAGCRHTVFADTELKLIEVQLGQNIHVGDKKKYELEL